MKHHVVVYTDEGGELRKREPATEAEANRWLEENPERKAIVIVVENATTIAFKDRT